MKFRDIIPKLYAGKSIRRKSWPANMRFNKNDNYELSMSDVIGDVDDWEIYVEPSYDEFLEEMKRYLYDELEFHKDRQSRYYPEENMDINSIWNVINDYYLNTESVSKLLRYIKDNNLAKKR